MLLLTCPRCLFGTTTSTAEPNLLPHTSKRNRIRMQLHVGTPAGKFHYKSDFRVLYSHERCYFSADQNLLIAGGGHHRVSQTSETPFPKILPSPAPVVVQYSTVSQLKSCVGLLHACMHNAYPIPPYRHRASPDSRENSIAATLHRHRHAAYMTLQCIYINQPLPSIHYLSINNAQPQPQRTQIPSFPDPSFYSIFAYTSCNGMPDGLHTLRLGGARCRKAEAAFLQSETGARQFSSRERMGVG
jgi:hypothetical protein